MTKFGILSKFIFLQDIAAIFVSKLNPAVTHNVEKYRAIQKAFYLSALDQLEGDYYEFGVYAGSSITCAIRCAKSLRKYDAGLAKCCFFGFDSFLGFGEVDNSEKHSFYNDENFKTNYNRVYKRVKKMLTRDKFELVKGFFKETLQGEPKSKTARVILIDCDLYSSTQLALEYIKPTLQEGTLLILDDFFSYNL